jgi:phage gp36-like protein
MNYVTTTKAEGHIGAARLVQLYKLPDEQVTLEADLAKAEAMVDSFVGRRYATPVTAAAALVILEGLTLDLFAELAYRRGSNSELPLKIKDAAKHARDFLAQVAKGEVTLAGATTVTESDDAGAGAIVLNGNEPQFDAANMGGY